MRRFAHIMVFLLSCAALANTVLVQMEVQERSRAAAARKTMERPASSGDVTIYKTMPGMPGLVQSVGGFQASTNNECAIGVCQDI